MVPSAWVVAAASRATRAFVIGCQSACFSAVGWLGLRCRRQCRALSSDRNEVDTADHQQQRDDGGRGGEQQAACDCVFGGPSVGARLARGGSPGSACARRDRPGGGVRPAAAWPRGGPPGESEVASARAHRWTAVNGIAWRQRWLALLSADGLTESHRIRYQPVVTLRCLQLVAELLGRRLPIRRVKRHRLLNRCAHIGRDSPQAADPGRASN